MPKNDGKEFERIVYDFVRMLSAKYPSTRVEQNIFLPSQLVDSKKRQIDVLITSEIAGSRVLTIVECRDYKSKASLPLIDGLQSKMNEVGAQKAIMVTRRGFTGGAIRKAKRIGMTLSTLADAGEKLKNVGHEIPLLLTEYVPSGLEFSCRLFSEQDAAFSLDCFSVINGKCVLDLWQQDVLFRASLKLDESELLTLQPPEWQRFVFVEDNKGYPIRVENLRATYRLSAAYHFGYIQELPGTRSMVNLTEGHADVVFNLREVLQENIGGFARYDNVEDIKLPVGTKCLRAFAIPNLEFRPELVSLKRVA